MAILTPPLNLQVSGAAGTRLLAPAWPLGALAADDAASHLGLAFSVASLLVLFWAGSGSKARRGWKCPTQSTVELILRQPQAGFWLVNCLNQIWL